MENVHSAKHLNKLFTRRPKNPWLIIGLGGVVILGGLSAFNSLIAVTIGVVILLLVLVEPRPALIVYGLVLLLPLTGGLARGAVIPFLRVGQALVVLGFILFMLARSDQQSKSHLTAIDLAFVLYILVGSVLPVLALYYRGEHINMSSTNINQASPIQTLLGPIQYYLLYRIVVAIIFSERQIKRVMELMFVASIIVSVIGILEELRVQFVKTFLEVNYPLPIGESYYSTSDLRVASTLQHYSGLGAYLSFTIILVLACYFAQKELKISRLLLIITTLLDSIVLILTGTFAAWAGLAVGAAIVFLLFGRLPKSVIFTLIGIALALLIFQPFISDRLAFQFGGGSQGVVPESFGYRIMLWREYVFPAIGQHLIFGDGPTPAAITTAGQAIEESQYFHLLLEGGLLYLLGYLILFGVAIAACMRVIKRKRGDASRLVAIALLAILVAINVMNISGEYFTYVGGTQTLWTLLAIVVASGQISTVEASVEKQTWEHQQRAVGKNLKPSLNRLRLNQPIADNRTRKTL